MSWEKVVNNWHMEQPHPLAPELKVGEFPTAVRLATVLQFGAGHASPQQAASFWREFSSMNQQLQAAKKAPISPDEFTHLAKQIGLSSHAYHGRPPTMHEIARLRDAHPQDIHNYYGALPDKDYPTVPASDMAKALASASPWARRYLEREPNKLEASYLYHSGQSPNDYYRTVRDGGGDSSGGQPGIASPANAGGQPPGSGAANPGLAAGNAAAGGG